MSHVSGYFCIYTLTDGRRLAGLPAETQTLMTISRSVIFDLDGTLLDSLDDLADSVNFALAQHGLPPRTREEVRALLGNGVKALVRGALPEADGENAFAAVYESFHARYLHHCMDKTYPYPGVLAALQRLRAEGFALGIVSNKLDEMVQQLYRRFFASYVDVALGERPGLRRKPWPDGVRVVAEQLGCPPGAAVYVGDSEVDLATAANAGMPCLSVAWGFRSREYLAQCGARHIIAAPEDLPEAVVRLLQGQV